MRSFQAIILSGGSGTRLWPLSRGHYPKQFMDMGETTLFAQTLARAMALDDSLPPIVVCNEKHRFLASAILQEQSLLPGMKRAGQAQILLEPVARNTAPAIALSALAASGNKKDPLLLVLSSDHCINPQSAFEQAVRQAAPAAEDGRIVVFGVPPTRPETGFGYIRRGKEVYPDAYNVERFVEKPVAADAAAMLGQENYFWNSGMFLFRASTFLQELARHAPEVHTRCVEAWEKRSRDLGFIRPEPEAFDECPSISIDYAVMEHTDKACMVPLNAVWNDMGSWQAFFESAEKDSDGNACSGDVIQLDNRDCYLHAGHRLLATLGLEGLCVVETADAVLVLPRERSQEVKQLLEELARQGRQETETHVKVYRPWGSYESLVQRERFQVKRLIVDPGQELSLQLHHHRAEHWVVVQGTARVTVGDAVKLLKEDESIYIPLGCKHRLENPGRIPLEIIETQTGTYLGEDDIQRFEDTYGRAPEK